MAGGGVASGRGGGVDVGESGRSMSRSDLPQRLLWINLPSGQERGKNAVLFQYWRKKDFVFIGGQQEIAWPSFLPLLLFSADAVRDFGHCQGGNAAHGQKKKKTLSQAKLRS